MPRENLFVVAPIQTTEDYKRQVSFDLESAPLPGDSFLSCENVLEGVFGAEGTRHSNLSSKYRQLKDVTFTNALIGTTRLEGA
jgi:hypothetical protein